MKKISFFVALWSCKFLRIAMRVFGRNATYLPGKVALKICPSFLSQVGKPARCIAVTGTNGKTTSANLLIVALKKHGLSVLDNSYGSNTPIGLTSALVKNASLFGKAKKDIAVLEIDERSSMYMFPHIDFELVVVTNLFRDSIMRNAHPEYIAKILSDTIPTGAKLLLNADDPIACRAAPDNPRTYFGIERMESDVVECINLINDFQVCPKCQSNITYEYRRYHHIGKAYCPNCDFKSPKYDYSGYVDMEHNTLTITDKSGVQDIKLPGDSVFNIYNALTAYATLREIGLDPEESAVALDEAAIPASRYNEIEVNGVRIIMQMSKERNALACSRVFDYIASRPEQKELLLMMNSSGDAKTWSENICWLYDSDFEFLNNERISRVVTTGTRGLDYNLRLRFAGVSSEKICFEEREIDAPKKLALEPGSSVYIMYGTDAIDLAYRVRDAVKERILAAGANNTQGE